MNVPVEKITENARMLVGSISNAGVVLLRNDEAVLVDALSSPEESRAVVRHLADQGVRITMVVNTHYHWDHTGGNPTLDDAVIVASTSTRSSLLRAGPDYLGPTHTASDEDEAPSASWWPGLPDLSIGGGAIGEGAIGSADADLSLVCAPVPAHTASDLVVTVTPDEVTYCGDLWFNGLFPAIDPKGSVRGWLECLDWLARIGAETVVPGHGPRGSKADLRLMRAYLEWIVQAVDERRRQAGRVRQGPDAGETPAAPDWCHGWGRSERHAAVFQHAFGEVIRETDGQGR